MKKINFIFNCFINLIKKKIFKAQDSADRVECEKLIKNIEKNVSADKNRQEEYLLNYNTTTRWQTL